MEIEFCGGYEQMILEAGNMIYRELLQNPEMLLCAASGGSPSGTYRELTKKYK